MSSANRFAAILLTVLPAGHALLAQDKTVSSPPGFESMGQAPNPSPSNDRTWGYNFGQFQNERFQAADGQFNNQVMAMKEISYRLDQRIYQADVVSGGVGRSWTQVTLDMSECDYDKITSTYSTNSVTTPQRVFDATMTWTTMVGQPLLNPAPWGDRGIKFPFSNTFVFTGKGDLLLDYRFRGGSLANNASWTGSTSIRYYLDGFYASTFHLGSATEYPASTSNTTPPNCMDSAFSSASDAARNDLQGIFVYSASHSSRPSQIYLQWRSFWTAPNQTVLKAIGVGGSPIGVPVGARCNQLYLDTRLPFFLIPQTVDAAGKSPFTTLATPFQSSLGGATVWFQCAWEDSVSKAFSLTTATSRSIPTSIPIAGPRRSAIYAPDADAATGTGPVNNASNWGPNPMYLITYR